jgi:TolA-binding protein
MKKFIIAIVFLTAASLSYATFYTSMVEEDQYLAAMKLYDAGDFSGAEKGFDDFILKFPDSKYTPAAMLKSADLKENTDEKELAYGKVIKAYPGSETEAEAVFSLGRLNYAGEKYKKAVEYFNTILDKYGKMIWAEESSYYLMLCYLAEKDYADLDKTYAAYSMNGGYFKQKKKVRLVYADSMFEREKYTDASAIYKELIDGYDPKENSINMPAIYKKAAQAYIKSGDAKTAQALADELKLKFPDSEEVSGPDKKAAAAVKGGIEKAKEPEKAAAPAQFYTVQVGAYTNKKFCDATAKQFEDKKYQVFVKKDGKFFRLNVGKFVTKGEADVFAADFAKKEKLKSYLVKQAWE